MTQSVRTLGSKESCENCLDSLRDMLSRGLRTPVLITTDGAPGLIRAVEDVFQKSLRQRCLAHKIRNVIGKVADNARQEVKTAVQAAYYAPDQDVAEMIAAEGFKDYQTLYPAAMKSFQDDWHACIAYLRWPTHTPPVLTAGQVQACPNHQFVGTQFPGTTSARQNHSSLLHREELSQTGLCHIVASQPKLVQCTHG